MRPTNTSKLLLASKRKYDALNEHVGEEALRGFCSCLVYRVYRSTLFVSLRLFATLGFSSNEVAFSMAELASSVLRVTNVPCFRELTVFREKHSVGLDGTSL